MQNTARMANRLPEFMNPTNRDTLIFGLIDIIGNEINEAEDRVRDIMTSKWFPVAALQDLERIGSLFGVERLTEEGEFDYKNRLFQTVQELLKGVGTVRSISGIVTAAMGFNPEVIEHPATLIDGGSHLLKAGDKWIEDCGSAIEPTPTITIQSLTRVRNPTITNLTNEESITYNGLLRPGAFLTFHPDGSASLAGINVSDRVKTSNRRVPVLARPHSEWIYTDLNAFMDSSKFDTATFAGEERYSVIVQLYWDESRPATFIVKLPLYSNKYRPTEEISDAELNRSIGYEKELRQEVRNLVEKVKTAGVDAQINFWDDFIERNSIYDAIHPQINNITEDKHQIEEKFNLTGEGIFQEQHTIKDRFSTQGAFDITSFDSENRFG